MGEEMMKIKIQKQTVENQKALKIKWFSHRIILKSNDVKLHQSYPHSLAGANTYLTAAP